MKKRILATLLSLCLVIGLLPVTAMAVTGDISGKWIDAVTEVPDGYQESGTTITISSAEGMAWFAKQIKEGNRYTNCNIKLANDIDLGAHYWLNWGLSDNTPYFDGEFDGEDHTISNLYAIATRGSGLFPEIKNGGIVKNLKIQNVDFSAELDTVDACGVISPKLTKGTITNCHVSNGKITIRSGAGGIVGATQADQGGIISYCSVSGFKFTLTAGDAIRAGGIAGELRPGNIYTNCFVKNVNFNLTHTVASKEFNVGGIAGFNLGGSIDHCCVRGFSAAFTATDPVIKIGTVVGSFNSGSVTQCYATENETYAHTGSGATADVTILADSQFNNAANFSELDFGKVWCIEENNGLALQAASQFPAVFYAEKLNIQNNTTSGVIGSYNGSGVAISQQLAVSIPIGCNSVTISASPSSGATISGLPATVEFGEDALVQTCEFTVSYSGQPDKTYRITMTRPKSLTGDGTENNPIQVSSLEDLKVLSTNLSQRSITNAYVSITADIDCGGSSITPVASVQNVAGHQHTISNFTVSDPYTKNTGLFRTLNGNGSISDLYLENAHFSGGESSGLLVGTISKNASVTRCAVVNSEFLGNINHYNGLLFGTNNGTVSNCYVEGDTRKASNKILTGAIGGTNAGIVKNCYSDVYVKGNYSGNDKGPFVHSNKNGQITNCIWNAKKISNCFNKGPASHDNNNGTVTNSAGVDVGNGSFTLQQVLGMSGDRLPQPMRDGYAFAGWYVTSISENVETLDRAKTYQAKWTYTIDFNANGGTGEMAAQKITEGDGSTELTTNGFKKTGYTFKGWNTQANGQGTPYAVDAVASTVPNGTTLYAQWAMQIGGGSTNYSVNAILDQIYTGAEIKPDVVVEDNGTILNGGYTVVYENNVNAGTAKVTVTIGSNSVEVPFTIKPAPVTIKADDKTKTTMQSMPEFTYTATDATGNPVDLVGFQPVLTLNPNTAGTTVGAFNIVPSGTNGNYDITYENGTLTVTEAIRSTYAFEVNAPTTLKDTDDYTNASVRLYASEVNDLGYDAVLIKIEVSGPDGGNAVIKAVDTNSTEWNMAEIGQWGPSSGFPVVKDYDATTNLTHLSFDKAGEYTATFTLVDRNNNDAVLATGSHTITVTHEHVGGTATCANKAVCEVCGEEYGDLLDHSFTNYVSDDNATCLEDGTKTAKCDNCDATDTKADSGSALGHNWGNGEITTAPTCEGAGVIVYTCQREGCDETMTMAVSATGHTEVTDEAVDPTCTETGKTEGSHCSVCNAVIKEQTIIPATGHTEVTDEAVAPTCTETGLTEGSHCSVCNEVFVKQTVIPATGHTWNNGEITKQPTYDEPGEKTYTCEVCQATKTEEVPALSHHFSSDWNKDETYHWHDCTDDNCDVVSEKAAHTWDNGEVTTEPTYDAAGVKTYTCEVCQATKTEEIAKLVRPSSGGSSSSTPSYTVSTSKTEDGSVSVSPKNASKGDTVTITVKPDKGYELDTLTVTDKNGDKVKVTEKNGKYTFTMPSGKVNVKATFVEIKKATTHTFIDVPDSYWAEDEISWAFEKGYMNGTSETTFNPTGNVSRQQLWMIMARLSGEEPGNMAEAKVWAVDNGVSDGTAPGGSVTRQQMVTILYRFAQRMGYDVSKKADLSVYPDYANVSGYAQEAMAWAVANDIIGGTTQGTLNPSGTATRAQFAVILYRFCEKMA